MEKYATSNHLDVGTDADDDDSEMEMESFDGVEDRRAQFQNHRSSGLIKSVDLAGDIDEEELIKQKSEMLEHMQVLVTSMTSEFTSTEHVDLEPPTDLEEDRSDLVV